MLQHMQSHPTQSVSTLPVDLYGYDALIQLGCVVSPERFGLAIQSVNKTRRFRSEGIQLIVAIEGRIPRPWLDASANCSFHAAGDLQPVLDDYCRSGSLLIPDQNESAGDATLHALASGVPLDAMNFRPGHSNGGEVWSRHGDAFLAVMRARNRSN